MAAPRLARSYAEQMAEVALVTDSTSSLGPDAGGARRGRGRSVAGRRSTVVSRPETEVPAAEVAAALRAGRAVSTSRPGPEVHRVAAYADLAGGGVTRRSSRCTSAPRSPAPARRPSEAAGDGAGAGHRGRLRAPWPWRPGSPCCPARRPRAPAARREAVAALVRRTGPRLRPPTSTSTPWSTCGGAAGSAPAAAVLGSALSVKPLLTVADGRDPPVRAGPDRVEGAGPAGGARAGRAGRGPPGSSDQVDVAVHHLDNRGGRGAPGRPAAGPGRGQRDRRRRGQRGDRRPRRPGHARHRGLAAGLTRPGRGPGCPQAGGRSEASSTDPAGGRSIGPGRP